jgi:N-acetylglutamate synthase-like GNAT family acetyltransferase
MEGSIRRFKYNRDLESVLAIFDANVPRYFSPLERAWYADYLKNEVEDYFVLDHNDQIIGAGGLNYEKHWAVLSWGLIAPAYHGRGLGTQITQYRINFVRANTNLPSIIVRTSQHTDGFYTKMGFKVTERKKDFWGKGMDLAFMEMQLERE